MFYKVKAVKALENYYLQVTFLNDEVKLYDVKPLFKKWQQFLLLQMANSLFEQVKVDAGGYAVSWNDELDLSCNELYENGNLVE